MSDRMTARVVGVLFIVATATAIAGGALVLPIEGEAALAEVAANENGVISGVLVELVLVASVIGIATVFFPILRRRDEGLAVSYVGARIIEGVLLLAAAVSALVVVALSGADDVGGAQPLVDLLVATRTWTYLIGSMIGLGVSAAILYSVLYRARLVPAWLSVWGLVGAVGILARGVLETYGIEVPMLAQVVLTAPIAVNEMVLAVWLIVRGTSPPAPAPTGDRAAVAA